MSKDISPQKAIVIGPGVTVSRSDPRASQDPPSRLQSAWDANVLSFSNRIVYRDCASDGTVHRQAGLPSPPETRYQVVPVIASAPLLAHAVRKELPTTSSTAITIALRTRSPLVVPRPLSLP